MLLSLMIVCALAAILLFALGAFEELRDLWMHPDHRPSDEGRHFPRGKPK